MAIEIETLGYAGPTGTASLLSTLLIVPLFAFIALLSKISPQLVNSGTKPRSRSGRELVFSWKRVLGISTIPLLATVVAAPILYFVAHQELGEPVYNLNLDDTNSSIPKEAKFIALTGRAAPHVAAYREGDTDHVFTPITASGWTPADPVRFIAYETVSLSDEDQQFAVPDDFRPGGATRIEGRISRLLPVVIERKYKSRGLKIAPSCLVVDETGLPTASDADVAAILTGVVGVALTLLVLFTLILLNRSRKRANKRANELVASLSSWQQRH